MHISLNWIRDFVELPIDADVRALAERFTRTTAEVEEVKPVSVGGRGLIVARVEETHEIAGTRGLRQATLRVGEKATVETVTSASNLAPGSHVVYAPEGSSLAALGSIGSTSVSGRTSKGLIPSADALGIVAAAQEAITVGPTMAPGQPLPPEWFDDWVIEIDNKSLTHRPDLWGHYGIAREIAAILGKPLRPYSDFLSDIESAPGLPEVSIDISAPQACRRYSGIIVAGVGDRPSPLWMQLRLGHVGMRPISASVDLTNYVMAELGQPMHAFDAKKADRIEVAFARDGERFTTLDGVERKLSSTALMIQSRGRSIALAGIMGGRETEVSPSTTTLLLESACFDPSTIRKTASSLGLRTDASARFEKSLDPANTILSIQRFIQLAKEAFPDLKLATRLSDRYPRPLESISVQVKRHHVQRTIGREATAEEITRLLTPLGFQVKATEGALDVAVPSFRATRDISIEADVIEEIARCAGYDRIAPSLPSIATRQFEPHRLHELEQESLRYFSSAHGFHEIHGYIWDSTEWMKRLGAEIGACVELVNPSAEGARRLRRSLLPGLLASMEKNRFFFSSLSLLELGSVFHPHAGGDEEHRHLGLLIARRSKRAEDSLFAHLKGAIANWIWGRFSREVDFVQAVADEALPWEHPSQTATAVVGEVPIGKVSVLDSSVRRAMDEHLIAWSGAWAELRLEALADLVPKTEKPGTVPAFPLVEMDFSMTVSRAARYVEVADRLKKLDHPLLRDIRFVTSYEGESVGHDRRSLTFRTVLGDDSRTLQESDAANFRAWFEEHVGRWGYEIRK